jgi:hypothetical protein
MKRKQKRMTLKLKKEIIKELKYVIQSPRSYEWSSGYRRLSRLVERIKETMP